MKMIGNVQLSFKIQHKPDHEFSFLDYPKMNNASFIEFKKALQRGKMPGSHKSMDGISHKEKDSIGKHSRFHEKENPDFNSDGDESCEQEQDYGATKKWKERYNPEQEIEPKKETKKSGAFDESHLLDKLESRIDTVLKKKNLLSLVDVNGSVIIDLIDIVSFISNLLCRKISDEKKEMIQIPDIDETRKSKSKGRIFLEGKVELSINKYKSAVCQAKGNNPCSLAYQLTKTAFPTSYINHITLGRKNYTEDEVEYFRKVISQGKENRISIPLAVAWGFSEPYDKPLVGDFDFIRGQDRVQAFIGMENITDSYLLFCFFGSFTFSNFNFQFIFPRTYS